MPSTPRLLPSTQHKTPTINHQPHPNQTTSLQKKACAAYLSFIVGMIVQLAPAWGEDRILLGFYPLLVLLSW